MTLVLPKVVTGMSPSLSWGAAKAPVSRMDLHPKVQAAAAHVRHMSDLGITYFGTLGALSSLQRFIGGVFGMDEAVTEVAPPLPPELRELSQVYGALATNGPLAMMPYTLTIE